MKTKIFTFLFALILSVGTLFAQSGTCGDNLTWELVDGTLTISGMGDMYDYSYRLLRNSGPWNSYSQDITLIVINDGVTSIGEYAFYCCQSLTSVTIPNSVTSIGKSAFEFCRSMTSIETPNSVTNIGNRAFKDCESLTSITIPNSVTSIGDGAFFACSSLTSVTIGNSVTTIGEYAFDRCDCLTCVTWNAKKCNKYYFGDKVESFIFGDSVKVIPDSICLGMYKLTSVKIPNSVTGIGESAFYECSGLTSVAIGNSVTSIGDYVFDGCSSLTSVTIPNSVTSIGYRAFFACKSLTSVTLGKGVTTIGRQAFEYCNSLTSIDVAMDNPNYCSLNGVLFNKDKTILILCSGGKQGAYCIPNSVTSVGDYAFGGCTSLTYVVIPNSVTSIGWLAFSNVPLVISSHRLDDWGANKYIDCSGFIDGYWRYADEYKDMVMSYFGNDKNVIIPSGVTFIYKKIIAPYSWYNEENLNIHSLEIPNGVKDVEDSAFYNCPNLSKITCYSKEVPKVTEHALDGINKSSCILYVLAECLNNYVQDNYWGDFVDIRPIGASSNQTDGVTINPESTSATVVWPEVSGAATYELVIKDKDGNVICTLVFNAKGQLTSIAFAPARDGSSQQAQTAGFSFTVTGLDEGTGYDLTITAKSESGEVLNEKTVSFFTNGGDGIDDVYTESIPSTKLLRNGQVLILRGDKTYTLQGQEVK